MGSMNTLDYITNKFPIEYLDKRHRQGIITKVNREIMCETLGELGFKVGAEIGVAGGHHAEYICKYNPGVKLFCVDVWAPYDGYHFYDKTIAKLYEDAKERLKSYDCELIRKMSKDAARDFGNNFLDFVYLDAGHDFENIAIDLCAWVPKVKPGGIVFGHDYKRSWWRNVDVKDVVPAYCTAKRIKPLFELKNDIKDSVFGTDNPGWMFVRREEDELFPRAQVEYHEGR